MPTFLNPSDHDDKDVRRALQAIFAERPGEWCIIQAGHWGTLRCLTGCCAIPIAHTPRNPTNFARRLEREARRHPLGDGDPRSKVR
jgi:hypothetical protein